MNRSLERLALCIGIIVLLCSVQFGACLGGGGIALPAAFLLSAATTLLWLHFELPSRHAWLPPLVCVATVMLAVLIVELTFPNDFAEWFCFVPASMGSGLTTFLLLRSRARCALCNSRLAAQALSFQCPRCHLEVCDETCWNFEHRRCILCLEQRVPILPTQEQWWTRSSGPRSVHGRCQICLGSSEKLDLRVCSTCRRPQCRDCWDFNNGDCQRCGTTLPNLPVSLSMTVAQTIASLQSRSG